MGLDITAYRKLTPLQGVTINDDGEPPDYDTQFSPNDETLRWTEKNWPGRTAGILSGIVYGYDAREAFHPGSYGGYNAWRRDLTVFAGYPSADALWDGEVESGPFYELINFADNEGVIGPVVASKLARDFAEHRARAEATMTDKDEGWFIAKYREWQKAFEIAADGGCVDFH